MILKLSASAKIIISRYLYVPLLMDSFTLICSSFACRISGSRPVKVEAVNLADALARHPKCLKCWGEMKGKGGYRVKRQ